MNFTMFGETFSPISFPSSISLIKHFLPSSPAVATAKIYIDGDKFWLMHLFHTSSSQKESGRVTNFASSYYRLNDNFRSLQTAQLTPPPKPADCSTHPPYKPMAYLPYLWPFILLVGNKNYCRITAMPEPLLLPDWLITYMFVCPPFPSSRLSPRLLPK